MADQRLEPLLARFPSLSRDDIAATFKRVTHELAAARRGGAGSDDWQCASLANRASPRRALSAAACLMLPCPASRRLTRRIDVLRAAPSL